MWGFANGIFLSLRKKQIMKQRGIKIVAMLVLLVLGMASRKSARADYIVFDNGEPSIYSYGNDILRWLQTDDFILTENTILTGAHFWTQETDLWDGTLEYFIFADDSGIPGTIINSGDGQSVVKNATGGATPGSEEYEYSFMFETPIDLGAGEIYWFGLHLASGYPSEAEYWPWSTSVSGFGSTSFESEGGTLDNWVNTGIHRAFYLEAVPEPGTLSLVALGILSLVKSRGTRKKT